MTTTRPAASATRPRFHLATALKLIAEHRCACWDCSGSLARCEFPSWRRCVECGCCWKAGEYPVGRRADYVRGRCRANRTEDASEAVRGSGTSASRGRATGVSAVSSMQEATIGPEED